MTLRINEWKEVCMMAEKRCYTVAELQEILGVSRPTVYSLLKNNFPMEKVHRHSNAIFIFPLFFQQEGRIDYE